MLLPRWLNNEYFHQCRISGCFSSFLDHHIHKLFSHQCFQTPEIRSSMMIFFFSLLCFKTIKRFSGAAASSSSLGEIVLKITFVCIGWLYSFRCDEATKRKRNSICKNFDFSFFWLKWHFYWHLFVSFSFRLTINFSDHVRTMKI